RNADPETVLGPAGYRFEAASVVLGHESPRAVGSSAPDLIMAVVVPRIPLIVARRVLPHPRSHRFLRSVRERSVEIGSLTGQTIELHGAELHIVRPVVLLVEVRRARGRRLTHARTRGADPVHGSRAVGEPIGERAVARLEHGGAQRERPRVFPRRGRETGGAVLVLEQSPGACRCRGTPDAARPAPTRSPTNR